MRTLGLRLDIECEVDDLGKKLTEKDALWLAVMRMLGRITCGTVVIASDLSVDCCVPLVDASDLSVDCCVPLVDGDVVGALSLRLLSS